MNSSGSASSRFAFGSPGCSTRADHAEQRPARARRRAGHSGVEADADADRAIVARAVHLLQQPRRDDEVRREHREVDPSRTAVAATGSTCPGPESPRAGRRARRPRASASGSAMAKPGQLDGQLHDVDDRRRLQPAGGEIDGDDERAQARTRRSSGCRSRRSRIHAMPISWPARMQTVPTHSSSGDGRAHAAVVAPLQEVADGAQVVLGGEAADARADPQREHQRAEAGRADPPPRRHARRGSRARPRRSWTRRRCSPPGTSRTAVPGRARGRRRRSRSIPCTRRATHTPERDLRDRVEDDDRGGHAHQDARSAAQLLDMRERDRMHAGGLTTLRPSCKNVRCSPIASSPPSTRSPTKRSRSPRI